MWAGNLYIIINILFSLMSKIKKIFKYHYFISDLLHEPSLISTTLSWPKRGQRGHKQVSLMQNALRKVVISTK